MTSLDYLRKVNIPRILLVSFILCTIVSTFYSAIPIYEQPIITVTSDPIPEYEFSITNTTWERPGRILLANLTPRLGDPSWYSSECRQREEYDARIVTENDSTTMFFRNQTAINETWTWNEYAGWSLMWPFAVLNYTELTAEWHVRVIQGNITVRSFFQIRRGQSWVSNYGSHIDNSTTEMTAFAGESITLMSTVSNFTEEFDTIYFGVLWVDLVIYAAQGSIMAVDNVEVWIDTDEPLASVTLDFQSLYGERLFANPSIVSQWLATAYRYDFYSDIGNRLSFFLKVFDTALPFGSDLMLATASNQTAYMRPGNYSLALGWSDEYMNDEYIFNLILAENTSLLMQIPLPFNIISFDIMTAQIPSTIRLSYGGQYYAREYFDDLNSTDSENVLMILPNFGSTYLRLSIPGKYWEESEMSLTSGANSTISIDFKLIPLLGIYFTSQQITGMIVASFFALLSLVMLLYRWYNSKDQEYLSLIPLILFVIGVLLPWYVRTDTISSVEYMTYYSPILGYRLWQLGDLFLIPQSLFAMGQYMTTLLPTILMTFLYGMILICMISLFSQKIMDYLLVLSIITVISGLIGFFSIGGFPWFGFWFMIVVPVLSYVIKRKLEKNGEDIPESDESNQ